MIYQDYTINIGETVLGYFIFVGFFLFCYAITRVIWGLYFKRKGWEKSDFKNLGVIIGLSIFDLVFFSFYWLNLTINLIIASVILMIGIFSYLRFKQRRGYKDILPLVLITECIMLTFGIILYYLLNYYFNLAYNIQILPI